MRLLWSGLLGAAPLGVGVREQLPVLREADTVQEQGQILIQGLHVQDVVRPGEIIKT